MKIFFLIISIFILTYLAIKLLMKHLFANPQKVHQKTPADMNVPFTEVSIPTKNHRRLYGWWIPRKKEPASAATVILVHGWGRNVERMLDFVENLHPRCNLLLFDARNHGRSEKDDYATMLKFAEDILASVDFLASINDIDLQKIYLIGHSIGGAASIYAAAHDKRIKKVIAVGAFSHPGDVMKITFQENHLPAFVAPLIFKYVESKIGKSLDEIAPKNNIANAEADILLIHGNKDKIVPFHQAEINLERGRKESVQLWQLDGIGHSNYGKQEHFWERIETFLCKN